MLNAMLNASTVSIAPSVGTYFVGRCVIQRPVKVVGAAEGAVIELRFGATCTKAVVHRAEIRDER